MYSPHFPDNENQMNLSGRIRNQRNISKLVGSSRKNRNKGICPRKKKKADFLKHEIYSSLHIHGLF